MTKIKHLNHSTGLFTGNETNSCLYNVETDTCNSTTSGYDEQECIRIGPFLCTLNTYQWQWRNCNTSFVSLRQLLALPSNEGHQWLLSMWEVQNFESTFPTSHACNADCFHDSPFQLYQAHEFLVPASPQANANHGLKWAHLRGPVKWVQLELLVEMDDLLYIHV